MSIFITSSFSFSLLKMHVVPCAVAAMRDSIPLNASRGQKEERQKEKEKGPASNASGRTVRISGC
jgi:hypothetical protein